MIKKYYSNIDVLTAARQRIKNIFKTSTEVYLSVSGGKDSIVLNDIVFKLCQSGQVDKSKLTVNFIDEEAIYPCVEEITKKMRLQWLSLGVKFNWWCIEVKHFNCFNMLSNDESFVCWDSYKKDVWVRPMPSFAVTDHPLLNKRKDTYQEFMTKISKGKTTITGVRTSESLQRLQSLAKKKDLSQLQPIYDFTDKDVWLYIKLNNLEIPDAYIYMYQVGIHVNKLRLSQFFSIDTAKSLVNMCEFYPKLFDRICRREPNAYLAMLYYDTELFRRSKEKNQSKKDEDVDYKQKTLELIGNDEMFTTPSAKSNQKVFNRLVINYSSIITQKNWKRIYQALIGGDPKHREYRAIQANIMKERSII